MILLSVCMIVKNESVLLKRCLESIKSVADEIIVVDTGSTDPTIAIAQSCGAQVLTSEWKNDFSYSRNISLKHANGAWILWLDADDVVPQESLGPLGNLKNEKPDVVYSFIVRNQKPSNTGSEFYQARMFPRRSDVFFERRIHEQMMPSALRAGLSLVKKPIVIEHHGYADPATMAKKAQRNVELLECEVMGNGFDAVLGIEIADSYMILNDVKSAEEWYCKVLDIPGIAIATPVLAGHALLQSGNIDNQLGKFALAIERIERSLTLCPNRPDALYSLAIAYEMQGDVVHAITCLKRVMGQSFQTLQVGVDVRETRVRAALRLERLLRSLKNSVDLLEHARTACECMPDRPEIFAMAGFIHLSCDKSLDALHNFETSLRIAVKGNLDAYIGLCTIYSRAGKIDLAHKTLDTIQPLFADFPRYWVFRKSLLPETFFSGQYSLEQINSEERYLQERLSPLEAL